MQNWESSQPKLKFLEGKEKTCYGCFCNLWNVNYCHWWGHLCTRGICRNIYEHVTFESIHLCRFKWGAHKLLWGAIAGDWWAVVAPIFFMPHYYSDRAAHVVPECWHLSEPLSSDPQWSYHQVSVNSATSKDGQVENKICCHGAHGFFIILFHTVGNKSLKFMYALIVLYH